MHELEELKDRLCDELKRYADKDISTGALDVIDKLAHAAKNIDKLIYGDGYSRRYDDGSNRSRGDRSYRRDSSRDGMADKLRELADKMESM